VAPWARLDPARARLHVAALQRLAAEARAVALAAGTALRDEPAAVARLLDEHKHALRRQRELTELAARAEARDLYEEAAALPLRKDSARAGTLRVIEIEGFDFSPCGGTHAGRTGEVGLIAGSLALRDHIERQFGFEQIMTHEYPHLSILPVREGRDDWQRVEEVTAQLLKEHPNLIGIYNAGGGTRGIIVALEKAKRERDIVFIAHELTNHARKALIRGTVDAIINQDAGHEVRSAVRVLLAKADNAPLIEAQERIRIDIFLRDNLP
jgi:hypothetical protein